jgi:hypothetical protein
MQVSDKLVTISGFSGCTATVQLEAFAYPATSTIKNRFRPSKIKVNKLVNHSVVFKASPPVPISGIDSDQYGGSDLSWKGLGTAWSKGDDDLASYDKGHIIANELGGPDSSDNIVPMYPFFNRNGAWRCLELEIGQLFGSGVLTMEVEIAYGVDGRIPSAFAVAVAVNGAKKIDEKIQHLVPKFDKVDVPKEIADLFAYGKKNMPNDWGKDQVLLRFPTKGPRPYAVLDWLVLEKKVTKWPAFKYLDKSFPESNPESNEMEPFGDQKRALVKMYNAWENGGFLKSDAYLLSSSLWGTKDPFEYLREYSAHDKPEVDHIIPKGNGGYNYYRNARLVSWFLNNKLERMKDYSGLVENAQPPAPYSLRSSAKQDVSTSTAMDTK